MDNGELRALATSLRAAQGFALNVGAIVIELATAPSEEERISIAKLLLTFRSQYQNVIKHPLGSSILVRLDPKVQGYKSDLQSLGDAFETLPQDPEKARITPADAAMITRIVRVRGVPAIMELIAMVRKAQNVVEHDRKAQSKERLAALDTMFSEVEQIGRMIHLISLNASVEAARAGGESGRSFKVIADEIRSLAAKSAKVIDTTRAAISDGDGWRGGL